jgi:DNA-binding transcriptional regulator GbsR (MarR family)
MIKNIIKKYPKTASTLGLLALAGAFVGIFFLTKNDVDIDDVAETVTEE